MKFKKLAALNITFLLVFAVLAGCAGSAPATPSNQPQVELLIGAAMSLRHVVEELSEIYQEQNQHVTLIHTFGGSGGLQTQIEEGAPIDIFMSAAAVQMDNLQEQGLIYGTGRKLVRNTLALIVPVGSDIGIEGFEDVTLDAVRLIGVGDPETAPVGRFTQEAFISLGIIDEVEEKSVLGNDVRQVLTWVETGEVDAGVVYMTDALTSDAIRIVETADPALHSPSVNPVGIVEASPHKEEAQNFIDFLFSDTARAVFKRHGFSMYQD